MKIAPRLLGISTLMIVAVSGLAPLGASAFSAYGGGTTAKPYQIGNCAQLQEISDNLSANYVLIRDIDCGGNTINSIGDYAHFFSGTFDGNNHTITNFVNNQQGLFATASGATFKNLRITNATVNATDWDGGLVGIIQGDTTIQNVHTSLTMTGYGYTGGLVGLDFHGVLTISQSSFTGTIHNGNSYQGGLVGAIDVDGSSITDSYATGTVDMSGDAYNGGLVGAFFGNATLTRSYSASIVNLASAGYSGGMVGYFGGGSILNSFAANTISGSGSNSGAVGGLGGGTITNTYYDTYLAGGLGCVGTGGSCTAVNGSNATPGYFKNNSSNGPLSGWDFGGIWQTNTNGYPTLRNEAGFAVISAPNGGDANGDGTQDNYQANVASIKSTNNLWSTVQVPLGSGCYVENIQTKNPSNLPSSGSYTFVLGNLTDFDLYCPTAGQTVAVTIILDKQYDTTNWKLGFYNPTTGKYSTVPDGAFGSTNVGGITKTTFTYNLTDGSDFDSDGTANGIIRDPIGVVTIATDSPTAPNTGTGAYSSAINRSSIIGGTAIVLIIIGLRLLGRRDLGREDH